MQSCTSCPRRLPHSLTTQRSHSSLTSLPYTTYTPQIPLDSALFFSFSRCQLLHTVTPIVVSTSTK